MSKLQDGGVAGHLEVWKSVWEIEGDVLTTLLGT